MMEHQVAYLPTNSLLNQQYSAGSALSLSMGYNPLERQITQIQMAQEPEDPPETLHTPWGIWLHKRDPLHGINQRYDTEHLIRTGMVAEDILHYAHYAPIIEGPNHEHAAESHERGFGYDYSHEFGLYNAEINFGSGIEESENIEVTDTIADASEERPSSTETESDETETSETLNVSTEPHAKNNKIHKRDLNLELEKELMILFEKFLTSAKING